MGDGTDGVDDNDGKYPRATARLFRFTGNIVASPSPPPSPPPASPSPSSAGDDPTFIGSDGAAYHVCIAAVPPMHPCDAASQLPAHNQAVCQPNAHAAHEFLSTRTVLCTRPPFPTSPPRLPRYKAHPGSISMSSRRQPSRSMHRCSSWAATHTPWGEHPLLHPPQRYSPTPIHPPTAHPHRTTPGTRSFCP